MSVRMRESYPVGPPSPREGGPSGPVFAEDPVPRFPPYRIHTLQKGPPLRFYVNNHNDPGTNPEPGAYGTMIASAKQDKVTLRKTVVLEVVEIWYRGNSPPIPYVEGHGDYS